MKRETLIQILSMISSEAYNAKQLLQQNEENIYFELTKSLLIVKGFAELIE